MAFEMYDLPRAGRPTIAITMRSDMMLCGLVVKDGWQMDIDRSRWPIKPRIMLAAVDTARRGLPM